MKCGEVLYGGLLSHDPYNFKECLAHLVNQRLMRIIVTSLPSANTTQNPTLASSSLSFLTGGSWEDKDPQVATQYMEGNVGEGVRFVFVLLVHMIMSMRGVNIVCPLIKLCFATLLCVLHICLMMHYISTH